MSKKMESLEMEYKTIKSETQNIQPPKEIPVSEIELVDHSKWEGNRCIKEDYNAKYNGIEYDTWDIASEQRTRDINTNIGMIGEKIDAINRIKRKYDILSIDCRASINDLNSDKTTINNFENRYKATQNIDSITVLQDIKDNAGNIFKCKPTNLLLNTTYAFNSERYSDYPRGWINC